MRKGGRNTWEQGNEKGEEEEGMRRVGVERGGKAGGYK